MAALFVTFVIFLALMGVIHLVTEAIERRQAHDKIIDQRLDGIQGKQKPSS